MHLIIPMAGEGKRMRPHTLTTPKPLIPVAGKPIVERLVEELSATCATPIRTIGFVVSELTPEAQARLVGAAQRVGAEAQFYTQQEALGTGHAVLCAQALLQGPVVVAFADTLFKSAHPLNTAQESVIWVKKVQDPTAFGVVQLDGQGQVAALVEKPQQFVSDLAIIGIYYFQEGADLLRVLQTLVDQDIRRDGEYQLTAALTLLQEGGTRFAVQEVTEWLDCGNQAATIHANQRFLQHLEGQQDLVSSTAKVHNSVIIPPVYLGDAVTIRDTVLGPYVAVGDHSCVQDSRIQNSIIQGHSTIKSANLKDSMLGNYVHYTGSCTSVSIGDYSALVG